MLTGKTFTISACALENVDQLKMKIQDSAGISSRPTATRFPWKAATCQADNISKEYTLTLILRLRGGMFHESSARQDFSSLSNEEQGITLKLTLPNGD